MQGKAVGVLLSLVLVFGIGVALGVHERGWSSVAAQGLFGVKTVVLPSDKQPETLDFSQFWKAWYLLEDHYIPTTASATAPSPEERVWGAIKGLTESYGDPYTVFLPPSDAQNFAENISGEFQGVGMEIGIRNGVLTVVAPLKGTPAERAGIRSGDLLLFIDHKPTEGLSVEEAVKRIRGPKGSVVVLTIVREGESSPLEISVTRNTIHIPILNHYLRSDGIFVIELYSFSENSPDLFRAALRAMVESGSTKLLLDVRSNPGGFLQASVEIASYFLPVGDVVVSEDFMGKQETITHRSFGYDVFHNKKLSMAILVDRGSASASEILAGALREHGVAVLIGEKTFGKGSVQELLDLGGGAELKVTIARWLTPKGTSIAAGGLTPDLVVPIDKEDIKTGHDPQLEAVVLWLLNH